MPDSDQYDPPPADLTVHRVALQEVHDVIAAAIRLDPLDCAYLRGIVHAALCDAYTLRGERVRDHPEVSMRWHARTTDQTSEETDQ